MKIFKTLVKEFFAVAFAIIFTIPVILVLTNSFKTQAELFKSFIALPTSFNINNYVKAWENMKFFHTLTNTLICTVFGVTGIIIISSMMAYKIARMNEKIGTALLIFFVLPMMIPFQTIMIPLMKVITFLHLQSTLHGYILVCIALVSPFTIFLIRGFVAQLPIALEEAAFIDGANVYQTFFFIVFPCLKPVIVSALILNTLWVWNEFSLSLLMLSKQETMTLQITVYRYFGAYALNWDVALATLVLASFPIIIFYILMQNQIQKNIVAGSIKG